mmetsp:Transcript_17496/g.31589  ORF Transcript_17496/g.31589 Transcript_17496/m.31589 type:complete len:479 (-) Transcript_17496:887-2323(-)
MAGAELGYLKQLAKTSRLHEKVREKLITKLRESVPEKSAVILQGGDTTTIYDTDTDYVWFQESFFHYLFGMSQPGLAALLLVETGEVRTLLPRLNEDYAMWFPLLNPNSALEKFGYQAHYADEIASVLESLQVSRVLLNSGTNSDSGNSKLTSYFWHPSLEGFDVDKETLFTVLSDCRAVKTPEEIEMMRVACRVGSEAHVKIMQACKPGMYEYNLSGIFEGHMAQYGFRWAYSPISASGRHGSILHYPDNEATMVEGGLVLADMGCAAYGYKSDITTTFPVGGKFTDKQRGIYEAVLSANRAVISQVRPGVQWTDMHLLADKVILTKLAEIGIVQGDVDEMVHKRLGAVFLPHGLGHLLGLDCHDVGGYGTPCCPPRSTEPGLNKLRTRRTLEEGMVITVEPGIYFIDFIIDKALKDENLRPHLNVDKLEEYRGFGGVRIEDDIVITADGCEILNIVPRTVEEIERVMSGEAWAIPQ